MNALFLFLFSIRDNLYSVNSKVALDRNSNIQKKVCFSGFARNHCKTVCKFVSPQNNSKRGWNRILFGLKYETLNVFLYICRVFGLCWFIDVSSLTCHKYVAEIGSDHTTMPYKEVL